MTARRLALLVAFTATTPASAVQLAPDGLGQALFYPYYTVNGNNQTILSVVNTKDESKALRVRFVEGRNGREVLGFNLYLGPHDVWTAAVFSTAPNGGAALVTNDGSCTAPAIRDNANLPQLGTGRYVPFVNFGYLGVNDDGGGTTIARTREGRFEVIEMGVLRKGTGAAALAEEVSLGSNGLPVNCGAVVSAWQANGAWLGNGAATGTDAPSGGLFGTAAVVDVDSGTMIEYAADAIESFYRTGNAGADLHFAPGDLRPSLDDARSGTIDPPVRSVVPVATDDGFVRSSWARGVDALSAVFMADTVANDFTTDAALGAATEWVVTFPTKAYYTDSSAVGGPATLATSGAFRLATPPFAGFGFTRATGAVSGSFACETIEPAYSDRAARTSIGGMTIPGSPSDQSDLLCEQVNVVAFNDENDTSDILGSTRAEFVQAPFVDGWLQLSFPASDVTARTPGFTSLDGDVFRGLPLQGFAAVRVVNALAGGASTPKIANYAGAYRHKSTKSVTAAD